MFGNLTPLMFYVYIKILPTSKQKIMAELLTSPVSTIERTPPPAPVVRDLGGVALRPEITLHIPTADAADPNIPMWVQGTAVVRYAETGVSAGQGEDSTRGSRFSDHPLVDPNYTGPSRVRLPRPKKSETLAASEGQATPPEKMRTTDRAQTIRDVAERFRTPEGEGRVYSVLLRRAAEGTLSFDPRENVVDAARAIDGRDKNSGLTDLAIPVDGADGHIFDSLEDPAIPEDVRLRLVQQIRFARSLGCQVGGRPRIEGGLLKMRIAAPTSGRIDPSYLRRPPTRRAEAGGSELADLEPIYDESGQAVEPDAMEHAYAANYFLRTQEHGMDDLTTALHHIEQAARNGDEVSVINASVGGWPDAYAGGLSYQRALAQALGFHANTPGRSNGRGYRTVDLGDRQPGFGPKAAPVETIDAYQTSDLHRWSDSPVVFNKEGGRFVANQQASEISFAEFARSSGEEAAAPQEIAWSEKQASHQVFAGASRPEDYDSLLAEARRNGVKITNSELADGSERPLIHVAYRSNPDGTASMGLVELLDPATVRKTNVVFRIGASVGDHGSAIENLTVKTYLRKKSELYA